MLKLFNTLGKRTERLRSANKDLITVFTCGPSVYQRAHIGNFRTFLFEDILVRYLEYSGYTVKRGMNFTDIEDKAINEARKRNISVKSLTGANIESFIQEMNLLKIKVPDFLPKASEAVQQAADIIEMLLDRRIAYRHKGNIYFDPNKYPKFGELYGLDMTRWPTEKRRFHKDTYPGMRWNLGDFILWHGYKKGEEVCWDTKIGKGRPSWNIQDPSMIIKYFDQTISIYCGGIDNLIRHHDYSRAILESIRPYPMAGFWLHCHHLLVNSKKMSKSKGNIYYTDTLLKQGYDIDETRFFLIYSHYRKKLNYSPNNMHKALEKLKKFKEAVAALQHAAGQSPDFDKKAFEKIKKDFARNMDNDLDVKGAFDSLYVSLCNIDIHSINPAAASGFVKAIKEIDKVLQVIF